MDIALFSPSSLFGESDGNFSVSLILFLLLHFCFPSFMWRIAYFVDEEKKDDHQNFVERKHQFPSMVMLFIYLFIFKFSLEDIANFEFNYWYAIF